jgi:hypothetical protein
MAGQRCRVHPPSASLFHFSQLGSEVAVLIMLEGLDRTGKTTLGNAIAQRLGSPVIHKGQPKSDWYMEYVAPLAGYGPGLDLVLDRWHWGEMVWPEVFDRPGLMTMLDFRYADRVMSRLGGVAILGTGDIDALWEDALDSNEPITTLPDGRAKFVDAARRFHAVAGTSTVPAYEYDYRANTNLDEVVAEVVSMAHAAQRNAAFNASSELENVMESGRVA